MPDVSDSYAAAGVDIAEADEGVRALVEVLKTIDPGRPSASVLGSGHYANVLRVAPNLGIAVCADGVGSKVIVAEQTGRYDTVGIDCIAMNVNDVICVGAEPLAMLDYIAIDRADPAVCAEVGVGLARGAKLAGIEIPGGELAQLGEMVRGVDVSGACFGTVALDEIIDGSAVQAGDVILGLPSSGLHSNGYTLARSALDGLALEDDPEGRLGRALGDELLVPTEIYVKPILELLRSEAEVRGLAHITSGGLSNLLRLAAEVGYAIEDPLPVPAVFSLIQERSGTSDEEMHDVFNMGCGFCCVVAAGDEDVALELLRRHYPGAKRIGVAVEGLHEVHRT
jgi:phosphoribosylformylglycinamidine cyclo-ligase